MVLARRGDARRAAWKEEAGDVNADVLEMYDEAADVAEARNKNRANLLLTEAVRHVNEDVEM